MYLRTFNMCCNRIRCVHIHRMPVTAYYADKLTISGGFPDTEIAYENLFVFSSYSMQFMRRGQ